MRFLLISLWLLASFAHIAHAEEETPVTLPDCEASADDTPEKIIFRALRCSMDGNRGFDTTWVAGSAKATLTFVTDKTDLTFRAYWIKTSDVLEQMQILADAESDRVARPKKPVGQYNTKVNSALQYLKNELLENQKAVLGNGANEDDVRYVEVEVADIGWEFYPNYTLMLVGTDASKTPAFVTLATAQVSPFGWSVVFGLVVAIALFGLLLVRGMGLMGSSWRLFAGIDGRMSLSSVQIALFTSVVIVSSFNLFLRTGSLGGLSEDVLMLMGIIAAGSAAGKVGDRFNQRLSWENWTWLFEEGWVKQSEEKVEYKVGQLVRDGQDDFDIFRFQAVAFSLLVSVYMLSFGLAGLAGVELDDSILQVLGLSQVTYIGGKMVGTPKWSEFDDQVTNYRNHLADPASVDAAETPTLSQLKKAFKAVFGYPPENAGP